MKITLNKKQWYEIGKTAGWFGNSGKSIEEKIDKSIDTKEWNQHFRKNEEQNNNEILKLKNDIVTQKQLFKDLTQQYDRVSREKFLSKNEDDQYKNNLLNLVKQIADLENKLSLVEKRREKNKVQDFDINREDLLKMNLPKDSPVFKSSVYPIKK